MANILDSSRVVCAEFISCVVVIWCCFFFFKQKTAYEMRISDWSSDVCSSDLVRDRPVRLGQEHAAALLQPAGGAGPGLGEGRRRRVARPGNRHQRHAAADRHGVPILQPVSAHDRRSEEHTSELQSLMRISYAVFCLKKTKNYNHKSAHPLT